MLRISATVLEQFRRMLQTDYTSEESVIAQVKGRPFAPSWQMQAGSAWHTCLEKPIPPELETVCVGNFSFSAMNARAAKQYIGPGVWEVKGTRIWDIGCRVQVVAKADHVHGLFIQDNKTKFSTADSRDYERSLQWRFYLAVHQATCFRYNLFSFSDPKGSYCELRDITSFRFWPYDDLESDCEFWLREFVLWCQGLGIAKYLERHGSTEDCPA